MHRILTVIIPQLWSGPLLRSFRAQTHTPHTSHTPHTHHTERGAQVPSYEIQRERERDDREGGTGQTERDMTQGSAAKKAKCGRTQIVRTSDHVPSHKIDESEVLYSTCASPARGESNPTLSVYTHTHTHTEGDGGRG